MLPTLGPYPEVVLEEQLSVRLRPTKFKRGDMVVAWSPLNPTRPICKRVLGVEGDVVCVDPYGSALTVAGSASAPSSSLCGVDDADSRSRRDDFGRLALLTNRARGREKGVGLVVLAMFFEMHQG